MLRFGFDNTFVRDLPGAYVAWQPSPVAAPRLLYLNEPLTTELGLDATALRAAEGVAVFAGNALPEDAEPIAQAYAGHQFGHFSPQLGDGRALLLGELIDRQGLRRDIALKGSGRTPFSRGGDGKAAVGPMLREVLIGEAMQALGIPTTRALAVVATGEQVIRQALFPGAVLTRVAASHLRVGSFQYLAARSELETLRQLADHAIQRHDPALAERPDRYFALLQAVALRQAGLIAQWMNVGFIHGVMNTDNMTISGETIDYGPCAFLEAYHPDTVFSSIDHGGRYAYGNQPHIARWNLARLAEALMPLLAAADDEAAIEEALARATALINAFPAQVEAALLRGQRAKLGLHAATGADDAADTALVSDWLALLQAQAVDFTLAWRHLAATADGKESLLKGLFSDPAALDPWLARWRERCAQDEAAGAPGGSERVARMRRASPRIIPRNHLVEEALAAATEGHMAPFEQLLAALLRPFDEAPELAAYAMPAAAEVTAAYETFCGT